MESFVIYLIKGTLCLTVFAVLFRLTLMRETFFQFTRITLFISLIACCILPFVKLKIDSSSIVHQSFTNLENIILSRNILETTNVPEKETELSLNSRNDTFNQKNTSEQFVKSNNLDNSNQNRPLGIVSINKSFFCDQLGYTSSFHLLDWIGIDDYTPDNLVGTCKIAGNERQTGSIKGL